MLLAAQESHTQEADRAPDAAPKMVPPRTRSQGDMAEEGGAGGSRLEASLADGIREVTSSGETRVLPAAEVVDRITGLSERAEAAEQKLAEVIAKMHELETSQGPQVPVLMPETAEEGVVETKVAEVKIGENGGSAAILKEMKAFREQVGSRLEKLERSQAVSSMMFQEQVEPVRPAPTRANVAEESQALQDTALTGNQGYGGLNTRDLVKLYQRSLSHVTVSKVLDPKFPALRAAWQRVRTLYPLPWELASSVLSNGFKDRAAVVYEEVVAKNMTAGEQEVWSLLEKRLYNPTQVETMRNEFETIKWKSEESVTEYADRLRELASCLPDVLSEQALCSRFIGGLPRSMKAQATVADSGNLDALVATTARLAAILGQAQSGGNSGQLGRREKLYEMSEENQEPEGPLGCPTNPVGSSQGRRVYAPHRELKCYRCHRFGHVATGRYPCTWDTTMTGESVQSQGNDRPAQ